MPDEVEQGVGVVGCGVDVGCVNQRRGIVAWEIDFDVKGEGFFGFVELVVE